MLLLSFIRHAQSRYNSGTCNVYNIQNCGLSDDGFVQAMSLELEFDCIVLSPLRRAIQTYALSHIKTGKVIISDLFREFRVVGHPSNHLEKEQSSRETEQDLVDRAKEAMEFLRNLPYENIGVVTHYNFTAAFSKLINNDKSIYLANCDTMGFKVNDL